MMNNNVSFDNLSFVGSVFDPYGEQVFPVTSTVSTPNTGFCFLFLYVLQLIFLPPYD